MNRRRRRYMIRHDSTAAESRKLKTMMMQKKTCKTGMY
jgi:hypothetical protein